MINIYNQNNNNIINSNMIEENFNFNFNSNSNSNSNSLFENDINTIVSGTITQLVDEMYIIEFDNNNIKVPQSSVSGSVGDLVNFSVIDSSTLKQVEVSDTNINTNINTSTNTNTNNSSTSISQDEEDVYTSLQVSIKDIISSEEKYNQFLLQNKQADLDKIQFISDIKSTLSEMSNSFTDDDLKILLKSNLNAKNLDVFEFSDYVKESIGVDLENKDTPEEKSLLELREDKKKYSRMDLNMNGIDEEDAMRFEKILSQADLPITNKNIADIKSLDNKITDIKNLDDKNIFSVMKSKANPQGNLKDNSSITIDDLYSSKHSGVKTSVSQLPDIPDLDNQIKSILTQENLELTQENLELAKAFIKNDLEISTQSFNIYNKVKELIKIIDDDINNLNNINSDEASQISKVSKIASIDDLIARNLNYNKSSDYSNISNNKSSSNNNSDFNILNSTQDLINYKNLIPSISEYDIQSLINQEVPINLYNIYNNFNNNNNSSSNNFNNTDLSDSAISEKLNLAKIQMKLTMENIYSISKAGINIDTMSLSKVIDTLEELEETKIKNQLELANAPTTPKNIQVMKDVSSTISNFYIKDNSNNIDIDKGVYTTFKNIINQDIDFSLDDISKTFNSFKASKVLDSLETFQTQPIKKFGDGISKLEEQFEDFLDTNGFEVNASNKKALKILTANDLEFTQENLIQTKIIDQKLEFVHNNLHPLTVAKMLKDEFDPLEKTIDEVIDYLSNSENMFGKTSRELISSQILELDNDNSLSQEERSAMISIYRMLNVIEKNDSGSIGNILQSEKNLTFKNLLEASKLHSNYKKSISIDKKVDNSFGEREDNNLNNLNNLNKSYNELLVKDFIKNGSPSLIKGNLENTLEDTLEDISNKSLEQVSNNDLSDLENNFISDIRAIENTHQGVLDALVKNSIPITINNISIMSDIINKNKKPSDNIEDFKQTLNSSGIDFGTSILDLDLDLDLDLNYLSKDDALNSLDLLAQENIDVFDDILDLENLDDIKLMIIKNQAVSTNINFLQDNNKVKNGMYSLPIELSSGKISDLNMFIVNDTALDDKNLTMYLNFTNDSNKQVQAYIKSEQNGKLVTISSDSDANEQGTTLEEASSSDIIKILEKFNIFPEKVVYNNNNNSQDINIFQDQILI